MGKAPLILQYLHDHARLVCDRRNEKDGSGKWRITAIPDDQRRNIIFHYGSTENFQEFFESRPTVKPVTKTLDSPTLNYCEINLKSLERREMMRLNEKKCLKREPRITMKRQTSGIFSNGIQSNRILIPEKPSDDHNHKDHNLKESFVESEFLVKVDDKCPSTSSIYLTSNVNSSSDFENDLFNEPDDLESAHFHHQRDLSKCFEDCDDDWFNRTANFTQSQNGKGFTQRHYDYYHQFNSQR